MTPAPTLPNGLHMLKMIIMVGRAHNQKLNFQTKQEFHYLHHAHQQLLWDSHCFSTAYGALVILREGSDGGRLNVTKNNKATVVMG